MTILSLKSSLPALQPFSIGYADERCVAVSQPKKPTIFFDRPTGKVCNPVYHYPRDWTTFRGNGNFYVHFQVPDGKRVFYQTTSDRCDEVEIAEFMEGL